MKFLHDYLTKTVTDRENIIIANTWKVTHGLLIGIFTFDLGAFSRSRSCTFRP